MKRLFADRLMLHRSTHMFAVAACCLGFAASSNAAPFYWTDPGIPAIGADQVRHANADGSGMQTIISGLEEPRGMALDLGNGKLYLVDLGARAISRTNLDGTGREAFAPTGDASADVAIDAIHGKVYWTDAVDQQIHSGALSGQIWVANLDGSNVQNIASGMVQPGAVAVDPTHGKVYWTELKYKNDGLGSIQRANLDGSDRETLLSGMDESTGLAIDTVHSRMYWTEATTRKIQSANLDGTGVVDVLTGLIEPTQIDLALSEGKMYWTQGPGSNSIFRANLDGSGVETLISGIGSPWGIAVVPEPGAIVLFGLGAVGLLVVGRRRRNRLTPVLAVFCALLLGSTAVANGAFMVWQDEGAQVIRRADDDGTNVQDIVAAGPGGTGVAVDFAGQKVYWTTNGFIKNGFVNSVDQSIRRANLDGSNAEILIASNLGFLQGITLDTVHGKMYWADQGTAKISRANLDGTNVEAIVTSGTVHPYHIELDVAGNKMYWTDSLTNKIQRANLDGTDLEDLITLGTIPAQPSPRGLVVDTVHQKLYWNALGLNKIQRANFDGSDMEDLVTFPFPSPNSPEGLAIDFSLGKMYWTGPFAIQRANLDGTDVENLVTAGLVAPHEIVVGTVPEPGTFALFGLSAVGLLVVGRRRVRRQRLAALSP